MSNPPISITFLRGWWRSVIDGLRDAGPEFMALVKDLENAVDGLPYPGDEWAKPPVPEVGVALAAEIRDGGKYLLGLDAHINAEQAGRMQSVLQERFPNSTFALMSPGIRVSTEPLVSNFELLAAVKLAEAECDRQWKSARPDDRLAWAGASMGLHELMAALATQNRGGAGEPAVGAAAKASETAPDPAPSRKLTCTCGAPINVDTSADMPGTQWLPGFKDPLCDFHGYRDRRAAQGELCGWRHPCYPDLYCTMRADQEHPDHTSYDVRGAIRWNSATAAQAPTAADAAKDWPQWRGLS